MVISRFCLFKQFWSRVKLFVTSFTIEVHNLDATVDALLQLFFVFEVFPILSFLKYFLEQK